MKAWSNPEVVELNISCTEHGKSISTAYDEIRVDQNGEYWVSFSSGEAYDGSVNGPILVPEE